MAWAAHSRKNPLSREHDSAASTMKNIGMKMWNLRYMEATYVATKMRTARTVGTKAS
ncbi:hypothetical protein M413DRAFT_442552, partial [Hebeloma cylindrosporum]